MANIKKDDPLRYKVLEKGYRPIGRLSTKNPPKGGSGVPPKPTEQLPKAKNN